MKVFNNEITVRRNETFTIDKYIKNRDGSPYIISSALEHPFFLITVTNSLYNQKERYICNVWIPIDLPRFNSTIPVNISDFTNGDGEVLYHSFKDLEGGLPGGYVGNDFDNSIQYEDVDALFYCETNGKRVYKYWDSAEESWKDYDCRITYKFTHGITKDWIEGGYFYNIDLVDGDLDPDAIQGQRPIPISNLNEHIPILGATKLTVLSDLRGGM